MNFLAVFCNDTLPEIPSNGTLSVNGQQLSPGETWDMEFNTTVR